MKYICIENNIVKYCDIVYIRHHSDMIMIQDCAGKNIYL